MVRLEKRQQLYVKREAITTRRYVVCKSCPYPKKNIPICVDRSLGLFQTEPVLCIDLLGTEKVDGILYVKCMETGV